MRVKIGWGTGVLLAIVIAETGWLMFPAAGARLLRPHETEAARGKRLAGELGCFACHGPDGRGGLPNPGSRGGAVPSFGEKTLMMYIRGDGELREYVRDGAPARKRTGAGYRDEGQSQALRMPAFGGFVSESDLDALVAYLRAASGMLVPPEDAAARGEDVARRYGCFGCHGEMGIAGRGNPGSLKGYIPGFGGPDYDELVRNDEELLQWIREGTIDRLAANPAARYFLERQRIKMPAYGKFMSAQESGDVAAYVRWLASGAWHAAPLVR